MLASYIAARAKQEAVKDGKERYASRRTYAKNGKYYQYRSGNGGKLQNMEYFRKIKSIFMLKGVTKRRWVVGHM